MHNPGQGNNPHKRKVPQPILQQADAQEPRALPYFAEEGFIPGRGQCLIECRFLGHSELIILDHLHQEQQFAIVRAVGAPRLFSTGVEIPDDFAVGDFVYAAIANGRRIELGKRKMVLIGVEHVFGKFTNMPDDVLAAIKAQEEREAAEEAAKAAKLAASQQSAQ